MEALIVAGVTSAAWSLAALKLGPVIGFVDLPDSELKTHRHRAVPLGGIGIFLGMHLGLVVSDLYNPTLVIATGMVVALGLLDDRFGVPPVIRLGVQASAGLILGLSYGGSIAEVLVAGLLVVVTINAVNLFDGLDGLAGSAALASAVGLGLLAAIREAAHEPGFVMAAAVGGFLLFNWHPARVFLGDNGAYVVGLLLAFLILDSGLDEGPDLAVSLTMLGVFLVDLAATVLRRWLAGRRLFGGDRSHVYDQLHARGWAVPSVALTAAMAQVLFVAIALALAALDVAWWSWAGAVGVAVMSLALLWLKGFLQTEA